MRWWGSKPQSVTAQTLDSAAFLRLRFYLALPPHNFFYIFSGFFIPFLPPPGPIPYLPPYFTRRRRFYLYLQPLPPPRLARARSDRPPGWRPILPASTARLHFPPLMGSPRSSSLKPVSTFSCLVAPLCHPWPAKSGPCWSQGSPVQGYLRLSTCLHHLHAHSPLPDGLNQRPSPLSVPGGGVMFFVPLSPVHLPRQRL